MFAACSGGLLLASSTSPRTNVHPGRILKYKVSVRPAAKQKFAAKPPSTGGPTLNLRVTLPVGVQYVKSSTFPLLRTTNANGSKAKSTPVKDGRVLTWEDITSKGRVFKVKVRVDSSLASGTALSFSGSPSSWCPSVEAPSRLARGLPRMQQQSQLCKRRATRPGGGGGGKGGKALREGGCGGSHKGGGQSLSSAPLPNTPNHLFLLIRTERGDEEGGREEEKKENRERRKSRTSSCCGNGCCRCCIFFFWPLLLRLCVRS